MDFKRGLCVSNQDTNVATNEKKTFVLDTNVLLHDADSILKFQNAVLAIPLKVLEELDFIKSDRSEAGRNAREISRRIDAMRLTGDLSQGIPIPGTTNCIFKIIRGQKKHADFADFPESIADNAIILAGKSLQQQGENVVFVSKDINARIKADLVGLPAEDYRRGIARDEDFYKGFSELQLEPDLAKIVSGAKIEELLSGQKIYPNQYFIVWTDKVRDRYRIFRHYPAENRIYEVRRQKDLWSFQGKNPQQQMALDLLADDTVQLVALVGPAGTGKTFLTLLVGLHKVIVEKMYSRLFVARPLVSLGADIGFIPGDLQEKLFHWMHPIYDNLEYIFNEMREKEEFMVVVGRNRTALKRRQRKGNHFKGRFSEDEPMYAYNPNVHDSVTMLQNKGILGLEAITYMRGRSIPRQFMFIDEAQNLTAQEIKTIISRAGEGTKVILSGDPYQIDSPLLDFFSSGLTITSEKLKEQNLAGMVMLENSERSPLAKMAIENL